MARFGTVAQQYFDSSGKPLAGGKLYFYEPGTTTAKTVYSDSALTTSIAQPVTLDASGYQPDIFFDGQVKAVLDDADDVQIDVADPVGLKPKEQFPLWDSAVSYSEGALVQGSNELLYQSLGDANADNDPTSTSGFWAVASVIVEYNASATYNTGALVYYDLSLWRCNADATTGVTPATGASEWDILALPIAGGTLTGDLTGTTITVDDLTVSGNFVEGDYTITDGASVTLDPANGMRQTWTLGADRTPTIDLASGECLLLRVADGTAYTLTLTGVTWTDSVLPTLPTSGYALIFLIQIDSDLYGSYVGDVA